MIRLNDVPTVKNIRGISSKEIVSHSHLTMKNLILGPQEVIPAHQVPVDVTFFVLRGSGTIQIGKQVFSVMQHDTVICPPNTPMAITAGDKGLSFLNLKTPGYIVKK